MTNYFLKFLNIFSNKDTQHQLIIAKDRKHLQKLIGKEIRKKGNRCDLNHIDVSNITDMSYLFERSTFKGNISKWNTANVTNMFGMFSGSEFNGDISNWNVSNVKNMGIMFQESYFDQDISKWNVSSLECMGQMFYYADFTHDLAAWMPYKLNETYEAFICCPAPIPWFVTYDQEERQRVFDADDLNQELNEELNINHHKPNKKMKI